VRDEDAERAAADVLVRRVGGPAEDGAAPARAIGLRGAEAEVQVILTRSLPLISTKLIRGCLTTLPIASNARSQLEGR
jgi:hypothetical protein